MKNFLFEYQVVTAEILEERIVDEKKGDKEIDIKVLWQRAGVINNNSRLYSKELLEREIKATQKLIDSGQTVHGLASHPADGVTGTSDQVTHHWRKLWMESDGTCKGILTVLPTTKGKDIQILVSGGRKLGLSSRGLGKTTEKVEEKSGRKYLQVNDDYQMLSPGDWALSPAVSGAGNIQEELRLFEQRLNSETGTLSIEEAESNHLVANAFTKNTEPEVEMSESDFLFQLKKAWDLALAEHRFFGTFEEYRLEFEDRVRAELGLPLNEELTELEKKLKDNTKLNALFKEAKLAGERRDFVTWSKTTGKHLYFRDGSEG
jgi:hypothetical protein